MEGLIIFEMILCAIVCGISWKIKSKQVKLVAAELQKVYEEVIQCVNAYVVKGKNNVFSTNKSGNEHFREFGDKIRRELEILDIKAWIDKVCLVYEKCVSTEGKERVKLKFEQFIAIEFEKYMDLYVENEIKHIEESLSSENVFNMTKKKGTRKDNKVGCEWT